MRKLCYLITGLRRGGAEKQLLMMAKEAIKNNYNVDVFVLTEQLDMLDDFVDIGAKVYSLRLSRCNILISLLKVKHYVKANRLKFIHAHMFHSVIFSRLLKVICPSLKIISSAHCYEEGVGLRGYILKATDFLSYTNTHVSCLAMEEFIKNKIFNIKKSIVIPNAIEYKNNNAHVKNKNIITVGRLEEGKGFDIIIDSFFEVSKKYPDAKLIILGSGSQLKKLERKVNDYDLNHRVEFRGNKKSILDDIINSRVFVSASRSESFGMAICESIACDVISIIPNLRVLEEVLGNYNSKLIHDYSSKSIFNIICSIFDGENIPIIDSKQKIISDYNKVAIFNQWDEIYTRIL